MKPLLRTGALALLAVTTACSHITDNGSPASASIEGDGGLRTDATTYTVRQEPSVYAVDIGVRFTNPLNSAVAVPACHNHYRPILQKSVRGGWVAAFEPIELMCITPPHVIAAGETYEFTYAVRAGLPGGNMWPRFEVDAIPGTYRLVWSVGMHAPGSDNGVGVAVPAELRTSNSFQLTF